MLNKGRILIGKDDKAMVAMLTTLLQEEGFEIRSALGQPALLLAEEFKPNVIILLDLMMPQFLDGLEGSNRAKNNPKLSNIPIIVLSPLHLQK